MLFVVDVRMIGAATREKIKHRILLVGCERDDIERKLRWVFDATKYTEFSITGIEKVREKVHILSTVITQEKDVSGDPVIERDSRSQVVAGQKRFSDTEQQTFNLYAVGVSTTVLAVDEAHALRKVGRALIARVTDGGANSAAASFLSEDSTVLVEKVPKSSGYAAPRDVSSEVNKAHIVRG